MVPGNTPHLEEAIWVVDLEDKDTHISMHHNTVVKYIMKKPVMELFLEAGHRLVSQVPKRCWE